ncbi:GNAT superfamily N-acetyltransferase [Angulomicrobium tetraedrale]|uniref:GNAT superfamily N-acetyltransferase n=1 Tax=Ancylobacter tetraedralis TaxID=217068 RepID=A0A839ZAJ2_9HYPH|nr:GNAT family N-acetyltransferase [Ancylobacter tetraedralis]MBB3771746.1 GNAT superfamily N-acetyltransferase [Ancylobacter tetraedralis]
MNEIADTAPPLNLNGYTSLPPGKLAAIVTFLEMTAPPPPLPERGDGGLTLEHVPAPDTAWYRELFRRVGEEWLWFSRLGMSDAELAAVLGSPAVSVHALRRDGADVGLLELDFRVPGEVELAFFGVAPDLVGSGAGRFMMNRALALAWASGPARVHVHTCTLDHQAAVAFYMRAGFRPYARAIEVADDPRRTGLIARGAGRHAPLIGA